VIIGLYEEIRKKRHEGVWVRGKKSQAAVSKSYNPEGGDQRVSVHTQAKCNRFRPKRRKTGRVKLGGKREF